jgi:hypothetical protein
LECIHEKKNSLTRRTTANANPAASIWAAEGKHYVINIFDLWSKEIMQTLRRLKAHFLDFLVKTYVHANYVPRFFRRSSIQSIFFPEYPGSFNFTVRKFIPYCGITIRPFSRSALTSISETFIVRAVWKLFSSSSRKIFICAFEDNTKSLIDAESYLSQYDKISNICLSDNIYLLNHRCKNISKANIADVFEEIANYSLRVDPLTYEGKMVKKSDINAYHDGRVLTGPITRAELQDGYVYEKLINNRINEEEVEDLRAVIMGDEIPFVYRKKRKITNRFSNINVNALVAETETVFSLEEQKLILRFARSNGLDIGEMDILRDKDSGRIYIVDLNKTPVGPPNHLGLLRTLVAIKKMAEAFEKNILQKHDKYKWCSPW